jgi:hypothetical protein
MPGEMFGAIRIEVNMYQHLLAGSSASTKPIALRRRTAIGTFRKFCAYLLGMCLDPFVASCLKPENHETNDTYRDGRDWPFVELDLGSIGKESNHAECAV